MTTENANPTPQPLEKKRGLIEKHLSDVHHPLRHIAEKLLFASDYAVKQVACLKTLLQTNACNTLPSRESYFSLLNNLTITSSLPEYLLALRQFRHTQFLHLLLLQMAGLATTEEIMTAWSDCADALILHVLSYNRANLSERYGIPRDESGQEVEIFCLAMGKLGGRELNYSSDIDLIFVFMAPGLTDGEEKIPNQLYFTKVVQQLVHLLQTVTAHGFVFRVDLRLRPNGESGALVSSLAAMETYYQEQSRDWERYAMVKARVIDKSINPHHSWFDHLITPFVYRRYVDFSVIESLRSMKGLIEREVQLNPHLNDIKRGRGGIREIEFIIQNSQLIRGGRLPELRVQNAMKALQVLRMKRLLKHGEVLQEAYLYLRQLENVLQSINDQQTHSLPTDEIKQAQVILAMNHGSWSQLLAQLHHHQDKVSTLFGQILNTVNSYEDDARVLNNQLASVWQGHVETSMAVNLLSSLGFHNAEHCYQLIYGFRHGSRCRRLTQTARMRLDRFMRLLLSELITVPNTDTVLLKVIQLLENIIGRSAYLALLTENASALRELLYWFEHSPFMTTLLVNHPFLLEILLDQEKDWQPNSRKELENILGQKLAHTLDAELQQEILRQFKLTHWLMAARAELYGCYDAVRIGKFLSDVAEVIVTQVFHLASQQLGVANDEMMRIRSHFAILAYGKLGSREMNYTSDLDLVFLYTASTDMEALVTRLTQKILHMLTTRSQTGVLFAVDTRLRPSGAAGLLVSTMEAFISYQKNQAWIWEHQALLKARIVSGSSLIKRKMTQLKQAVLCLVRDKAKLAHEVLAMRVKISQHQEERKYSCAELLDLEFFIQFLVLKEQDPLFAATTHPLIHLRNLRAKQTLNKNEFIILNQAYKYYHQLLHIKILQPKLQSTNEALRKKVAQIAASHYSA